MTTLKRRIWYGLACTALVAAGTVALLPTDRAVNGLSREDIVEIQHLARMEMWEFAGTALSVRGITHSPRLAWSAVLNRIPPPCKWQNLSGKPRRIGPLEGEFPQNTWLIITTQGDKLTLDKAQGHWRIKEFGVKIPK